VGDVCLEHYFLLSHIIKQDASCFGLQQKIPLVLVPISKPDYTSNSLRIYLDHILWMFSSCSPNSECSNCDARSNKVSRNRIHPLNRAYCISLLLKLDLRTMLFRCIQPHFSTLMHNDNYIFTWVPSQISYWVYLLFSCFEDLFIVCINKSHCTIYAANHKRASRRRLRVPLGL